MKLRSLSLILLSLVLGACTRIEPGHVGIKVNLSGDNRGVSDEQLVNGRVFFNPFTTVVYEFPTFTQRFAWLSSDGESITFNSSEGAAIDTDVAFATAFKGEAVPQLFQDFRRSAGEIVDGWVRDQVRNCMNEVGSTMAAVTILGHGKTDFIKGINQCARGELESRGFTSIEISLIGEARTDDRVRQSIAQVIEATQKALRAEAEVRQAEAEANKVAASADGERRKRIAEAQGEADAILTRAKAQAEANRIVAQSVTKDLIQYESIRRWDGVLPRFTGGGAIPFVNVDEQK